MVLDEETGTLFWRERPAWMFSSSGNGRIANAATWNKRYAGRQAFSAPIKSGYLTGRIFHVTFLAHRVVFALVFGYWPFGEVDHINGNKSDNRPGNLRDVVHADNLKNMKLRDGNTTGVLGVYKNRVGDKWIASIWDGSSNIHLGTFDLKDDAIAARRAAERKYGFHRNHGRRLK